MSCVPQDMTECVLSTITQITYRATAAEFIIPLQFLLSQLPTYDQRTNFILKLSTA